MEAMKTAPAEMSVDVVEMVPVQAGGEDVSADALAAALDPALVARLAAQARSQGVALLGRDGLLQQLTKRFLEAALNAEMDEHLGYGKHEVAGRDGGNSRNGKRAKTMITEVGPVDIEVRVIVMAASVHRSWPSGSAVSAVSTIW
jgi:hypothetical protein